MENSANYEITPKQKVHTRSANQPEIIRRYKEMLEFAKALHPDWDDKNLSILTLELMKLEKE